VLKTDIAARVDAALEAFIESERPALDPEAQPLLDELESLIVSGGKRLRPRFCYWGFRAAGGRDNAEIVRVGAALELLHTMAMIHDDVMDGATTRRNRASTSRALAELATSVEHRGDPKRFGGSAAILTGMLGFVFADRLFRIASASLGGSAAASERYDRLRTRAIGGQYLDLLSAHRGHADEAIARRIASLKSGSYTVADPLAIGALLASAADHVVASLDAFGRPLGEAFQIRDDVLSTFGDATATGKDIDGDLREGKQTVLLAKARALADDEQHKILDTYVGDPDLEGADADKVRDVIVATGAREATDDLVGTLVEEAKAALADASIDDDSRRALLQLADESTARRS
jgi:geranylgeranyl diphosphate synthase, type I